MSSSTCRPRPDRTYAKLAETLRVDLRQVERAVSLFDEGNSVPFVARYRQEATGCLSDGQLREMHTRLGSLDRLEEKRDNVLQELGELNALTEATLMEIDSAETEDALEEICWPFRVPEVTEAQRARDAGMQPLAEQILEEGFTYELAPQLCGNMPIDEALQNARYILSEDLMRMPEVKENAESILMECGQMVMKVTELAQQRMSEREEDGVLQRKVAKGLALSHSANDPQTYAQYFGASLLIKKMKAHQVLAINRAENLEFLSVVIEWDTMPVFEFCVQLMRDQNPSLTSEGLEQVFPEVSLFCATRASVSVSGKVALAALHGIEHSLKASTERKVRKKIFDRAVEDATKTFSKNLMSLLLQPPLLNVTVMGVDPGFRSGCKLCVCDCQGAVLDTTTIYPHHGTNWQREAAAANFIDLVLHHSVEAIALGDGVASRETETFMCNALKAANLTVGWSLVSEDGASVYSASELASEELPDLDVSLRGAVSIARRLEDPLSELCKVNPAHLGVGLYQHDIQPELLEERLQGVVESAVNSVGIDLNTASPSLLSYVAGLSTVTAQNIVQTRRRCGVFMNREQLQAVDGIDRKTFQQCAGFLRVRDGENALDNTGVHPESYFVVHRLLEIFIPDRMVEENVSLDDLTELRQVLLEVRRQEEMINIDQVAQAIHVGVPTLKDIIEDILAPGRDVRGQAATSSLKWKDSVSLDDLEVGDQFTGTVKNVVEFGAFVDISIGITGLIHAKQMRTDPEGPSAWIDPHQVCKVGDKLSVEVVALDVEKKRVSLKIVDHELRG